MRFQTLKNTDDFKWVFKNGKPIKADFLLAKLVKNKLGYLRVGIVVSNKVSGKAVLRNQIRRRIREAIRDNDSNMRANVDLVITALPTTIGKRFKDIAVSIDTIIDKINIADSATVR